MDHILVINQVIKKSVEYNQTLYIAFIDCGNGFDSVEIPAVTEGVRNQGVQEACVNIPGKIYKNFTAPWFSATKVRSYVSRKLSGKATQSVQWLEVSSPSDWEGLGERGNGEYLSNIWFAGDIVLLSNTGEELQQMIEHLNRESVRVRLKINTITSC